MHNKQIKIGNVYLSGNYLNPTKQMVLDIVDYASVPAKYKKQYASMFGPCKLPIDQQISDMDKGQWCKLLHTAQRVTYMPMRVCAGVFYDTTDEMVESYTKGK